MCCHQGTRSSSIAQESSVSIVSVAAPKIHMASRANYLLFDVPFIFALGLVGLDPGLLVFGFLDVRLLLFRQSGQNADNVSLRTALNYWNSDGDKPFHNPSLDGQLSLDGNIITHFCVVVCTSPKS